MTVEDLEQARVLMNERKTTELCNEQREGHRCVLDKGHAGEHQGFPTGAEPPRRWR